MLGPFFLKAFMLEWFEGPTIMGIRTWGAIALPFQYVLSYDNETLSFWVSAKEYPNASRRINLGEYFSEGDARLAAETHYSNNRP
jgi:hypothetical protein